MAFSTIFAPFLKRSWARPLYLFQRPGKLDIPFHAQTAHAIAEGVLHVPQRDGYTFYLRLQARKNDPSDRRHVQAIAGVMQVDADGPIHNAELSIPIRLRVGHLADDNSRGVLNSIYTAEPFKRGGSDEFYNLIAGIPLVRGDYRIRVESLQDNPTLADIALFLNAHVRRLG